MLYWECNRRLAQLRRFRALTRDYFQNIQRAGWMAGGAPPRMNDTAQEARHEMNGMMEDLVASFNLLGVPHIVAYQPVGPGEYAQPLDVVGSVFALYQFQVDSQIVFDTTDRAIGAYENERKRLLRKCFNPFYWLELLALWLLRFPFKLLGAAGFDARKVEDSFLGKLLKLALGLATGLAAFLAAIAKIADQWPAAQGFLRRFAELFHRT